jgi:hypothetical protein
MTGFDMVIVASLLPYAPGEPRAMEWHYGVQVDPIQWAESRLKMFKDREPVLYDAVAQTMNPRHIGSLIMDWWFYSQKH